MIEYLSAFFERFYDMRTLAIIFVIIVAFFLSRSIKKLLLRSSRLVRADPTQHKFMGHLFSAIIYLVGIGLIIYMIPSLRALAISLLAGAGILAIAIGFASQQAFSNLVSGIFIIISKPYRVGDVLSLRNGEIRGYVEDITLRHTVINTFKNKRVIIPNSAMNNEIIENANIGDPKICKWVEFGISYDSDIGKAMRIMREEAEKHPDCLDNRGYEEKHKGNPKVNVRVVGLGDSSANLRAWVWAKDFGTGFRMACDLRKSIKERFDKEGIEIPFPYRTIVYKKDIKNNAIAKKQAKKTKR